MEQRKVLGSLDLSVDLAALGYPLAAVLNARVRQQLLAEVPLALEGIPEVLEVVRISGETDLLIRVVATGATTCAGPARSWPFKGWSGPARRWW